MGKICGVLELWSIAVVVGCTVAEVGCIAVAEGYKLVQVRPRFSGPVEGSMSSVGVGSIVVLELVPVPVLYLGYPIEDHKIRRLQAMDCTAGSVGTEVGVRQELEQVEPEVSDRRMRRSHAFQRCRRWFSSDLLDLHNCMYPFWCHQHQLLL